MLRLDSFNWTKNHAKINKYRDTIGLIRGENMTFMDWVKKNWIVALLVVLLVVVALGKVDNKGIFPMMASGISGVSEAAYDSDASYRGGVATKSSYYPVPSADFAPEEVNRMIEKSSSLSTEVKKGTYVSAEDQLRSIISSSGMFVLSENVNTYDTGWKAYRSGYYNLKVETSKYDSVLTQLKAIGEVKSFNENAEDITGSYTDLKTELAAEKERLRRYNELYDKTTEAEQKINLINYIFDQERRIKYMEQSIADMGNRVSYSTIYFSMAEKRSEYADVVFVKLSQLVATLVNSVNAVLNFVFSALPWLVLLVIVLVIVRIVRRKKRK